MKEFDPVDSAVPPVLAAYQSIVAPAVEAVIVTLPDPHTAPGVPDGVFGGVFIVATTAVLVAETHPVVEFLASA